MAQVVVVGAGLAGMASAVRLAKAGHAVTLVEQLPDVGGALRPIEQGGFRWDRYPSSTTLPGALRDLFRKSGRTLDREVELVQRELVREHRFEDGARVALPGVTRSGQQDAVDAGLGAGLGQRWLDWTDGFHDVWELLRKDFLERAYHPEYAPKELTALLRDRPTLNRAVTKLKDKRLKTMALHHAVAAGHDPRNVPWWMGFIDHVEQTFGVWTVPGGLGSLTAVFEQRLAERKVELATSTVVEDLLFDGSRVTGVKTSHGVLLADVVVFAIDTRRIPALAARVERTMPAIPPPVCHVGLAGDVPDLPDEVVLHGDAVITIDTTGSAPEGKAAWTISARGRLSEDLLRALARQKIDIRENVEVRVDTSPRQQVEHFRGSSYGTFWQGRATLTGQYQTTTDHPNVYAVGAHTTVSPLTPFVTLTSSLVTEAIGPA